MFWFSVTVNWLTASQSLLPGFLEVDHPDLVPAHPALGIATLDLDAVHQHSVEGAVAPLQARSLGPRQLAECIIQRIRRQPRIQTGQRVPQSPLQNHPVIAGTLRMRHIWCNLRPTRRLPAETSEPVEGRLLDLSLRERGHFFTLSRISALSLP